MNNRIALLGFGSSLYLISLFCPIFEPAEGSSGFIFGLLCLIFGFAHLAWYANPLLFLSGIFFLLQRDGAALFFSGAAIAVGLTTLMIPEIPRDTSGQMTAVVGYNVGFYLWLASMGVVLAAALYHLSKRKVPPPLVPPLLPTDPGADFNRH
jgi:hypothetical protein